MHKFRALLYFTIIFCLASCATAYKPNGLTGGYSEMKLNSNTYVVNFRGNGFTSPERVKAMALLRGADLTKQNGFRYFAVMDADDRVNTSYHSTPTTITGNSFGNYFGYNRFGTYSGSSHYTINPGETYAVNRYGSTLTIKMFPAQNKQNDLLDADLILSQYHQKK